MVDILFTRPLSAERFMSYLHIFWLAQEPLDKTQKMIINNNNYYEYE